MPRVTGLLPLSIWALFAVFTVLARRDRRLLRRLPIVGVGVATVLGLARMILTWGAREPDSTGFDTTFFHFVLALAGGAAIPTLCSWLKVGAARDLSRLAHALRKQCRWVVACVLLAAAATVAYCLCGLALAERGAFGGYDLLFNSDPVRCIRLVEGGATAHEQIIHKHPVFALLGRGLYLAIAPLAGAESAPILISALAGGLCLALAAEYFRLVTGSRALALALAGLLGVTSGHLVFAATPETYTLSAVTLVLLHLLVARGRRGGVRFRHEVAAGVLATGITTTHAVIAAICFVAARARRWRWWRFVRWAACLLTILAIPLVVQGVLLPNAAIGQTHLDMSRTDLRYVGPGPLAAPGRTLTNVARGVLAESVVGFTPIVRTSDDGAPVLAAGPYTSATGWLCLLMWTTGLLLAVVVVVRRRNARRPTFWAALLCLIGTAATHLFYGNEHVFLYSCTFAFYVLATAAHAAAAVRRGWLTPIVAGFGLLLLVNNAGFFGRVLHVLDSLPGG